METKPSADPYAVFLFLNNATGKVRVVPERVSQLSRPPVLADERILIVKVGANSDIRDSCHRQPERSPLRLRHSMEWLLLATTNDGWCL
jgi:hypothetical protein